MYIFSVRNSSMIAFKVFGLMLLQIVKKTFTIPGPSAERGKAPNQVAGEITSFLTRKNFAVTDRGETITYVILASDYRYGFLAPVAV